MVVKNFTLIKVYQKRMEKGKKDSDFAELWISDVDVLLNNIVF